MSCYDEFAWLRENAEDAGLPWNGSPIVERRNLAVGDGRTVSSLVWGTGTPGVVLLHGGAQNAHTWDTVVLALGRPALAVDLPGHGHSSWREDLLYDPRVLARDVATVIEELAPHAALVAGMSLGGMTAIALAGQRAELVRKLVLVDVTPGSNREKARDIVEFTSGPESFATFGDLFRRAAAYNEGRPSRSLRRGVLHNSRQREDGRWVWRHHFGAGPEADAKRPRIDYTPLWDTISTLACPIVLFRGSESGVVTDEDVQELRRRKPQTEVRMVSGAGHSIQGDRPVLLAEQLGALIEAQDSSNRRSRS